MNKLVIIRHGESIWNKENIFTGWIDVPLSETGIKQARCAGRLLEKDGYSFDIGFTSVLQRAEKTLDIILEEMHLSIPVEKSWRLNERHYGGLQGMNKDEARKIYGEDQIQEWRRSYEVRPPIKKEEKLSIYKYKEASRDNAPLTESLKDTEERVIPYWEERIMPEIKNGKRVVISAHGNSIRAIVRIIDNISGVNIAKVEIPTASPLVYDIDDNFNFVKKYYLDPSISCDF